MFQRAHAEESADTDQHDHHQSGDNGDIAATTPAHGDDACPSFGGFGGIAETKDASSDEFTHCALSEKKSSRLSVTGLSPLVSLSVDGRLQYHHCRLLVDHRTVLSSTDLRIE